MRLSRARHSARLRCLGLNSRFDGAEDLVFLDIPQPMTNSVPGYLNPDHQILNLPGAHFDEAGLAVKFQGIQKVALKHSDNHGYCGAYSTTFRCVAQHGHHVLHTSNLWKMCPDELCGFLNSFPNLREIYLVLVPDRSWQTKLLVRAYVDLFYACKPLFPPP